MVKNGILSATSLGGDSLNSINLNSNVRSAINFYQNQQVLPSVAVKFEEFMKKTQDEQLQILEDLAVKGEPIFICFEWYPEFNADDTCNEEEENAHAIVGYDIEYGSWKKEVNGKTNIYTKRVVTYDCSIPNGGEDYYIYYNEDGTWCIPGWGIISTSSQTRDTKYNNGQFIVVTTDDEIINAVDYNSGIPSNETDLDKSVLFAEASSNYSLSWENGSCNISGFTVSDSVGNIPIYVYIPATNKEENNSKTKIAILPSIEKNYTVASKENELSFSLVNDKYFSAVSANSSGSIVFKNSGGVSLKTDENANYHLKLTANEGYNCLPWYTVEVSGSETTEISAEMTDKGIIINGDNLNDIVITGTKDNENKDITVSTEESSIMIAEKDGELAAFEDRNGDGTFETNIVSSGNSKIDQTIVASISSSNIEVGNTAIITATAKTDKMSYISSDTNVAVVDEFGTVTAIAPGKTTITITADGNEQYNSATTTIEVIVIRKEIPITSIVLNKTKMELEEGTSEKLSVSYTPSDTTDEKKVTWKSDNEGVAKVASDGTVTAVKAGTATITATTSNGKSASCTVTVKAAPVVVDKTKLQEAIKKYDAYKESDYASGWSEFEKALADAKTIHEKADATQAEVDSARKKLEEAAGNLVEKKPISSIALNKTKLELEEGTSEKLTVSYTPSDTTDEKKVTWKSDNESVAKVSSDGTVTAVKEGTATITATTANGKSASCTVTVKAAPVVVDKTKLQEAIKKYNAYKESDYASGWSEFEKALAEAKTINEKADATQAEVDNARKKLEEAAGNLVEKKPISSIALNKTKLELEEGNSEKLTVSYTPSDTTDEKKVTWKSDNEDVAKVASDGTVTAVKAGTATITATTANGKTASCVITVMPEPEKPIQIYYRTHVQNLGWQSYVTDGVMSGTTGKSLRLEGIEIYLENNKIGGSIEYRTHVQNLGWQPYVTDGAMSGTKGKSLRLEAIQIRLTGELAQKYDVYYRTHIQDLGWLGWAVNDGKSGSAGLSKRLEGIQIRLLEKGESAPGTTENAYMTNEKTYHPSVSYSTHVQNLGWQSEVKDGVMSGTKGKSLRLEGIKIRVNGDGLSGGIEYSTHVQNLGWQPYVCNGEMAGTKGKSLRLEGIKIRLTGELAKKYSVEYRTHVQNLGWQDWVRDDSLSGTKGKGLRLEGIEIRIVKK